MALVLGLLTALAWGCSAFFSRGVSRAAGPWNALFSTMSFGLVGLAALLALLGPGADLAAAPAGAWLAAVAVAVLNTTATLTLYAALAVGALALVAPITASYAAVTALVAVAAGERLPADDGIGVALAVAGVALASAGRRAPDGAAGTGEGAGSGRLPPGLLLALAAAAQYGLEFWILGAFAAPALGGIVPILMTRVAAVVGLSAVGLLAGRRTRLVPRAEVPRAAAVGVLDAGAFACLAAGYALGGASVSVVTVVGSLYSAVAALLGALLLRERPAWWQWGGIALIVAGGALIAA
jgi:drug/metabolite transporter (DMT)-like permease